MRLYAYRLARELNRPNVDEMLEEIDGSQLTEWAAVDRIEEEMYERSSLQAEADAHVNQLRRNR